MSFTFEADVDYFVSVTSGSDGVNGQYFMSIFDGDSGVVSEDGDENLVGENFEWNEDAGYGSGARDLNWLPFEFMIGGNAFGGELDMMSEVNQESGFGEVSLGRQDSLFSLDDAFSELQWLWGKVWPPRFEPTGHHTIGRIADISCGASFFCFCISPLRSSFTT